MPENHGALVKLLIGMVGAGGFSVFVGCFLIRQGWQNFCEGRVPLGGKVYLTGILGHLGASALIAFGAIALTTGAILAVLCLWRLPSLIVGE